MPSADAFVLYFSVFILLMIIIKTVHFLLHRSKRWSLYSWFYFSDFSIFQSDDKHRINIKKLQNKMSIGILLLIVVGIFIYIFLDMNH